jgi:hypothetical protein
LSLLVVPLQALRTLGIGVLATIVYPPPLPLQVRDVRDPKLVVEAVPFRRGHAAEKFFVLDEPDELLLLVEGAAEACGEIGTEERFWLMSRGEGVGLAVRRRVEENEIAGLQADEVGSWVELPRICSWEGERTVKNLSKDTEEREKGNELGEGGAEAIERISRQYSDAASSSDTVKGSWDGVAGLVQRKRLVLVSGAVSTNGKERREFSRTSQRTERGREGVTN